MTDGKRKGYGPAPKLTLEDVLHIRKLCEEGMKLKQIAAQYNVKQDTLKRATAGRDAYQFAGPWVRPPSIFAGIVSTSIRLTRAQRTELNSIGGGPWIRELLQARIDKRKREANDRTRSTG